MPCARGMSYSISLNPTLLKKGGRIRRQLDQYGDLITIVVGKFNELEWGHKLLEAIAESRVALTARRAGEAREVRSVEKGMVVGELRRQLSVVNIRASMACLLDRLEQAGVGGIGRVVKSAFLVVPFLLVFCENGH